MNHQLITRHRVRDLIALAAALAAPPAAAAALLPWRGNWSNTNVALLLMVVVVAVATIGSRRAGALAALGAAAWFDFFFTVPYDRFTIRSQADITTFVLLLVVGLAVSQLAARARRLKAVTITAAAYLAQLHQTALLAQSAPAGRGGPRPRPAHRRARAGRLPVRVRNAAGPSGSAGTGRDGAGGRDPAGC
jgi:K+-sensing histidine kinase KdpD